jgi:hypothetical protein
MTIVGVGQVGPNGAVVSIAALGNLGRALRAVHIVRVAPVGLVVLAVLVVLVALVVSRGVVASVVPMRASVARVRIGHSVSVLNELSVRSVPSGSIVMIVRLVHHAPQGLVMVPGRVVMVLGRVVMVLGRVLVARVAQVALVVLVVLGRVVMRPLVAPSPMPSVVRRK